MSANSNVYSILLAKGNKEATPKKDQQDKHILNQSVEECYIQILEGILMSLMDNAGPEELTVTQWEILHAIKLQQSP